MQELEIEKFIPQEYWSLQGEFRNKEDKIINSRLTVYDGNKVDKLDIKNIKTKNNECYKFISCS